MTIKIYIAGGIDVYLDKQRVIQERHFRGKQARLAFAYLVPEHKRAVTRKELGEVVWPEEMPPAWETALNALMSRLRSPLSGSLLEAHDVYLSSGFGLYRLLLPADTWIDLEACATAIDEAELGTRDNNPGRIRGPATIAANIARRPFLAGCQGPWVESQRRKLERQLVRALECHTKMWLSTGEPKFAVETATEAVTLDPLQESGYHFLMQSLAASGNRSEAIRTYHRLRKLLADELGVDPSPELDAYYLELLH